MRFTRFQLDGAPRLGLDTPEGVRPLPAALATDLREAITADTRDWASQAGAPLPREGLKFLPPLARPPKILCVGLNYTDHTRESKYQQPDYPTLFLRLATSLTAHDAPIVRPLCSDSLDFEGELAVVIGRGGRHIPRAHALDHVFGYSVFNDGSVREYQFKTPQWTVGKTFDATGGFGPVVVTADELPPGARGLHLQTRLNGAVVQDANTEDMVFDVASLIATISEAITLEPGDVIVAGTPAGIGWAREPRLLMRHGDVCEVSIEGIGTLRNPIADEAIAPTNA